MKNGRQQSETKGRKTELKDGQGAIVLQLHRAIKRTEKMESRARNGGGNAGIRGAMRRAGGFEREQVNVSQPLMMPEPF